MSSASSTPPESFTRLRAITPLDTAEIVAQLQQPRSEVRMAWPWTAAAISMLLTRATTYAKLIQRALLRQWREPGSVGTTAMLGEGRRGVDASLNLNFGDHIATDAAGNLYIADTENNLIRKASPKGIITTVAGIGTSGYTGDNGPATSAQLWRPTAVALDGAGNLFIADSGDGSIS